MVSLTIVLGILTGVTAGAWHVLSGPDHLAAVAPLAVSRRASAGWAGLQWALGHTGAVLVLGALILWFRDAFPLELVSSWCERLVGLVLIGIGLWGVRQAVRRRVHLHEHTHDGVTHLHVHFHDHQSAHRPSPAPAHFPQEHHHGHAALAVGGLHGLAGGSHFLSVLPALAFPSKWEAAAYLGAYGVGTILAMLVFSALVGRLAHRCSDHSSQAYAALMGGCSFAAVIMGAVWLF